MNNKVILATMLLLAAVIGSPKVFASPAGQVMAEVLINLNHSPTAAEKAQLRQLANDQNLSEHKRTLATALINLNHHVADQDKAKLKAITNDSSAAEEDRILANIILNLSHKPSSSDKQQLKKLTQG